MKPQLAATEQPLQQQTDKSMDMHFRTEEQALFASL